MIVMVVMVMIRMVMVVMVVEATAACCVGRAKTNLSSSQTSRVLCR